MDRVQAHRYFQAHNHERIHRLWQLAPARHSLILELLPFLFHINHKLLPGYVSNDTPAGLIDYRPDKSTLDRAKQLEKSFRYRRRALRRYPLRGLYLINSHGLLTYPEQPHFELWLLHSNLLKEEQRQQLAQKVSLLCDWTRASGLHLQPRLLAESELEEGVLSDWERDQFYSAGLVLAGSQPYWWLTSPEEDEHYDESVRAFREQRMLNHISLVDFGAVRRFSADDLFHQTEAALYDSLLHGKQLLDLHYLSACLQQPEALAVSSLFKQQIYQQHTEIAAFDLHYLRLQLLEKSQVDEQLRQAFYLNSHESLSRTVRQAIVPWRHSFMKKLIEHWGWEPSQLKSLDQQSEDLPGCQSAFQSLGLYCKQLLRELDTFSDAQQLQTSENIALLRRLQRLRYEPELDRIDCLPLSLRPVTSSERLYLTRFRDDSRWYLSRQALAKPTSHALFEHESLLQVLAFAIGNRLLSRSNWLSVTDQHQKITTASVVELTQQLLRTALADSDLRPDAIVAGETEKLSQAWLFINLEQQPADRLTQQGLQLSSKLNDPLNYSSYRHSLVLSIDGLIETSLGLYYSFSFSGEQATLETLRYLLSWQADPQLSWHSWCPTAIFGQAISLRVRDLLSQVMSHHLRFKENGKVLFNVADRPYSLQWQQQQISIMKRPLSQDIWQSLADNQDHFSAIYLDRYLDTDGLLNSLLQHQASSRISVFIYTEHNTIICYLLDEFGNLIRQQYQHLTESTLIAHLQLFLSEIKTRNQVQQLRFYRLSRRQQDWQATPLAAPAQSRGYLPIKISMSSIALDADCSVICGQRRFEGQADDPALFEQVHRLVLNLRQQQQHYPVYLNSLEFEDHQYYPAALYMQQKQRLESLFNPE